MADPFNLQRFLDAQAPIYDQVRRELMVGRKQSHWMWFIFPQIAGLGRSAMAERYAITSIDEMKFRSSMTLFARTRPDVDIFQRCIDKYFSGRPDPDTIARL